MPDTKHTPGPWKAETNPNLMSHGLVFGNEECLVKVYGDNFVANARLIAASPDLLGALTRLLHEVRMGNESRFIAEACNEADKAIAKAEGRE